MGDERLRSAQVRGTDKRRSPRSSLVAASCPSLYSYISVVGRAGGCLPWLRTDQTQRERPTERRRLLTKLSLTTYANPVGQDEHSSSSRSPAPRAPVTPVQDGLWGAGKSVIDSYPEPVGVRSAKLGFFAGSSRRCSHRHRGRPPGPAPDLPLHLPHCVAVGVVLWTQHRSSRGGASVPRVFVLAPSATSRGRRRGAVNYDAVPVTRGAEGLRRARWPRGARGRAAQRSRGRAPTRH
jgi:hypothetical protein